jgi:hypothetical protein
MKDDGRRLGGRGGDLCTATGRLFREQRTNEAPTSPRPFLFSGQANDLNANGQPS